MAETGAFDGVIASPLPGRTAKPRAGGQTMVIDKGLGLTETRDLLELAAPYIDFIKSCSNWVREREFQDFPGHIPPIGRKDDVARTSPLATRHR